MRLRKFEEHLYEKLRDPEYARIYLEIAMEDSVEEYQHTLKEVENTQKPITQSSLNASRSSRGSHSL